MTYVRHLDHSPGIFGDKSRAGRYLHGNDVIQAIRDLQDLLATRPNVTAIDALDVLRDGVSECLTHDARPR